MFGRERELEILDALLDRGVEHGGAMVLRGEAGIGKSFLLEAARRGAEARGMSVLSTAGVESETHLPLAGLHQLLRPSLSGIDELPSPQREALRSAFGMSEREEATDLFLIALATLTLLGECAGLTPMLLIVEDAHWLDQATADALAFVARRLESDPIVMLLASRDGVANPFNAAGLPELELGRLSDSAAGGLLEAHAPGLPIVVRARLLDAADGNPLALVELPRALASDQLAGDEGLPAELPLTVRLERAFAGRVAALPSATGTLLLVAALNDSSAASETFRAAGVILGGEPSLEELTPAISAQLVDYDNKHLRFRHPLVRSAIRQAASASQRQVAHGALASVVVGEPDRFAWYRAAATVGPSEEVASALDAAATRAKRRGALATAVAALERAAELAHDHAERGSRLLRAAELALELGRGDVVLRLLRSAETLELGSVDGGRLVLIREAVSPGIPGDPATVALLVDTADRMTSLGESDIALDLLWTAATSAFWADRGDETREQLLAACDRVPVPEDEPRLLSTLAYTAAIDRSATVIERALRWKPEKSHDPGAMHLLGNALATIGAQVLADGFLTAAAERMREEGRLRPLAQVLMLRSWAEIPLGRWTLGVADAEEAARLARETEQPIWEAAAWAARSMLAGLRGEEDLAESLAADAERVGMPFAARAVFNVVQMARSLTALTVGRHADAYAELRRLFDPADPAHHVVESPWAIGNLAEAAVHSDHVEEARVILQTVAPLIGRTPSPWLHVAVRHASALLAHDADAEELFRAGLQADLTRWPFDRARLQYRYGVWLRRQRRPADSRTPLRAARDTFDALGATPWGDLARQELRAAGERPAPRRLDATNQLSPQELRIAQMAAAGLSNREIGERLFLSHRTVGAHLYRIFPKVGVTSRHDLRDVVATAVAKDSVSGRLAPRP